VNRSHHLDLKEVTRLKILNKTELARRRNTREQRDTTRLPLIKSSPGHDVDVTAK
jgi:hypothetical protein